MPSQPISTAIGRLRSISVAYAGTAETSKGRGRNLAGGREV